jgi:S-adenosylmethionine decarboxylase proenzyme
MTVEVGQDQRRGQYQIDIRVFLIAIAAVMAAAFVAGVSIAPLEMNMLARKAPETMGSLGNLSDTEGIKDLHLPAGQHLLVDIEGVDESFLNSEERLSKAMVDTVTEAGLHLLSYHCHALSPAGVSCVGVLLESHISFHTWPSDGIITLDLFTCGPKPLLPAIATIERLFGIPSETNPDQKVRAQWSHELRGFRPEEEATKNHLADSSDLSLWVLSPLEMYSKKQIYSGRTKYQQVDIWDVVEVCAGIPLTRGKSSRDHLTQRYFYFLISLSIHRHTLIFSSIT